MLKLESFIETLLTITTTSIIVSIATTAPMIVRTSAIV